MCGIFAIAGPDAAPAPEVGAAALEALRHRGPDHLGQWRDPGGRCWLGHTRLAIVAPDDGAQPLELPELGLCAVVNGEFYGYRAIRRELRAQGHRLHTGSDSEILLHLYHRHGLKGAMARLRGEFAFALWDRRAGRLVLGRDRFGVKPLVYTRHQGRLMAASEVKALAAAGAPMRWDMSSLAAACHHQYVDPRRTLFEGVATLEPGCVATFAISGQGVGPTRTERYWDMDLGPAPPGDSDESADWPARVRDTLERAVAERQQGSASITAYLSGGLDSSAVVALAADHLQETYGVSFVEDTPGGGYDESARARQVADWLGLTHHEVRLGADDLVEALPEAVWFAEGLCINAHLPAKFLLSRAVAAGGHRVVLTGEGADELLMGYPHLEQDLRTYRAAAQPWRARDETALGVMVAEDDAPSWPLGPVAERLGFVPSWVRAKAQLGHRVGALVAPAHQPRLRARSMAELIDGAPAPAGFDRWHPVARSSYLWSKHALAGYILRTLGDGTEMAHSLEGRTPFLDGRLWEACQGMPVDGARIRGDVEKWALREAVRGRLPDAIVARKKHPFLSPPISAFASGMARELLGDLVGSRSSQGMGWWDRGALEATIEALPEMSPVELQRIEPALMTVLSSLLLHRRFRMEFRP